MKWALGQTRHRMAAPKTVPGVSVRGRLPRQGVTSEPESATRAGLPKARQPSLLEAVPGIFQALIRLAKIESAKMVDAGSHICLQCEVFSSRL